MFHLIFDEKPEGCSWAQKQHVLESCVHSVNAGFGLFQLTSSTVMVASLIGSRSTVSVLSALNTFSVSLYFQ